MEISIAVVSLIVSIVTLWLTYLYKGKIKMTQPTTIFFGWDGKERDEAKVYLRTLLFSTSQRGRVVESMHVKLHRGESVQTFNIWVYGERSELVRGSGLYVGKEGAAFNHHFLIPRDGSTYDFNAGKYRFEIYVSLLNSKQSTKMFSIQLEVTSEQARKIKEERQGLYFDWGPESIVYHSHLQKPEPSFMEIYQKMT